MGGPHSEQTGMAKRSEARPNHLRTKWDRCRQSQKGGLQFASSSTPQCQFLVSPQCQRTTRTPVTLVGHLWKSTATTEQRHLLTHSRPCRTPRDDGNLPPPTTYHAVAAPSLSVTCTSRPAPTHASTAGINSAKTATSRTPPTDRMMLDVPSPAAITTSTLTSSDVDSVHTCPYCDHALTSYIGPVGHLIIHRTETAEPVSGAPINCP
ncbi:hypothetical protein SprV_0802576800 [Sparganum proliferum]